MTTLAAQVQLIADRQDVAAVPITYAKGVDTRDWALVRAQFTDDAVVEGSRASAPVDAYVEHLRPGVEVFPTTMHFMGNQLVEVDGDTATVTTYAVAYHWKGEPAGAPHDDNLIVGVRYHDQLARTAQGWRISARRVSPDWRQGPYPPV